MHESHRSHPYGTVAVLIVTFLFLGSVTALVRAGEEPLAVVGAPEPTAPSTAPTTAHPAPSPTEAQVLGAQATQPPAPAPVVLPTGQPWAGPIPFTSAIPLPDHLVFVLVVGSDARPGQDPTRARGDSLHLLAANPATRQGTIVGFPRDSWVDIPGHGTGKITSALSLGGPQLMVDAVRQLTGLPVDYYVVTGFEGFERLVDDMGGMDVPVQQRMDDRASGARFEAGWNRMGGQGALAFARNRKDTPNGDFSRSENQGLLMLSALAKMRSQVAEEPAIHQWLGVLLRHVRLDLPLDQLPRLAALGRQIDPSRISNVVVPGRAGRAGRASVVHLDPGGMTALFNDLRDDAVLGTATPEPPPAPPPPG